MTHTLQTIFRKEDGFTMVEILVAISVIGLLAGIVVTAINPKKQITSAQVTRRAAVVKQVNDELERMIVANTDLAEEIPVGADNAIRLCTPGAASDLSGCTTEFETLFENVILNDDEGIGYDIDYPESYTEFVVYKEPGGKVTVGSIYPTDPDDEMPEPSAAPCTEGGDPYMICTKATLENIANIDRFGTYQLAQDINLGGQPFEPIQNFAGEFDGNGNAISNLNINKPFANNVGLFGYSTGYIHDLRIDTATVVGGNPTGILVAAHYYPGQVENIEITQGQVSGSWQVGGMIGFSQGDVMNSSVDGVFITANSHAGYLIGGVTSGNTPTGCSAVDTTLDPSCAGPFCNTSCGGLCGYQSSM